MTLHFDITEEDIRQATENLVYELESNFPDCKPDEDAIALLVKEHLESVIESYISSPKSRLDNLLFLKSNAALRCLILHIIASCPKLSPFPLVNYSKLTSAYPFILTLITMPLSNCSQCRYLDRHPNHPEDIVCSVNPVYANIWQQLKTLDRYTLDNAPLDICTDFEIDPSLAETEITLSLTFQQWQQLARNSPASSTILNFLQDKQIEHSLSLIKTDWQAVANSSSNPHVLERLAEQGIEPNQPRWIEFTTSSAIAAISYDRSRSVLLIRFNRGAVYQYDNISSDVFDEFCHASSLGTFFNQFIKDHYTYQLL
ncbi:MAG TPA: KTSC domain-containing protein [Xenococcaceae cyanobacterium]